MAMSSFKICQIQASLKVEIVLNGITKQNEKTTQIKILFDIIDKRPMSDVKLVSVEAV